MADCAATKEPKPGCLSVITSCFQHKKRASPAARRRPHQEETTISNGEAQVAPNELSKARDDAISPTSQASHGSKYKPILVSSGSTMNLWSAAYKEIDEETKKWIGEFDVNCEDRIQAKQLTILVRKKEDFYKSEESGVTVGEKRILWRDYANRVVAWATTIGDISVQFAPAPAAPVWSALKVLLKAHVAQLDQVTAILGCADRVLSIVRRGQVYEVIYNLRTAVDPSAVGLRDSLIKLYKGSLEFLALAATELDGGWPKKFLQALTNPGRAESILSDLSNLEAEVLKDAGCCEREWARSVNEKHQELLQTLYTPLRRVDNRVGELLQTFEQAERQRGIDHISNISVDNIHVVKRDYRTKGTCEWLIEDPRFLDWEESSYSSILWLNGQIGAGKSFLTSKVIDRYRADPRALDNNDRRRLDLACAWSTAAMNDEGFAYFYCDRYDSGRKNAKSILSSYIVQLLTVSRHRDKWHSQLRPFCGASDATRRSLGLSDCKQIVTEIIGTYPRSVLILDALDECDEDSRMELAGFFRELVDQAHHPVKIFVSSRPETDITEMMKSSSFIQVHTAENMGDIKKYIDAALEKAVSHPVWSRNDIQAEVRDALLKKSDGMFKWVELQWAQLKTLNTATSIRNRLETLPNGPNGPNGLFDTYQEIYSQQENHDRVILQRAVKWVKCARMTTKMLLQAVQLSFSEERNTTFILKIDKETLQESNLAAICRHLIVKDPHQLVWKFPHASVAEFFESDEHSGWTSNAEQEAATLLILCLYVRYTDWLLNKECSLPADRSSFKYPIPATQFPAITIKRPHGINILRGGTGGFHSHIALDQGFAEYAIEKWTEHIMNIYRTSPGTKAVSNVLRHFVGPTSILHSSSPQFQAWFEVNIWSRFLRRQQYIGPVNNPIFTTCFLGSLDQLQRCCAMGLDIYQVNDRGRDLLYIAAGNGHDELCSHLISKASDPNRPWNKEEAFLEAVKRGQISTAKLLLANEADPNLQVERTPLCAAVTACPRLVLILLAYNANPNVRCQRCTYSYPLEAAFFLDDDETAKLLLHHAGGDNEVDIGTAVYYGALKCARLLVEDFGVDVNAPTHGHYGTALGAAFVGSGSIEMIEYLVTEAKADTSLMKLHPPQIEDATRGWGFMAEDKIKFSIEQGYLQPDDFIKIGFPAAEMKKLMMKVE